MINATEIRTEKEYRAIRMDSSSSLKEFAKDRKKYYKRYILEEDVQDEESKAAIMGRLVETKLMEPEFFDERFYPSVCETTPTGMMLDFVEALYKYTKEATDANGDVKRSFEDISQDAYRDSGYKITYDRVIKNFIGSDAEVYYQEIREVRSKGLTVVSVQDVLNAEKIVMQLQNDLFVGPIVNIVNSARFDVHNQYQVDSVEYNGVLLKGMFDKVIIDHDEQVIQVYDLKCTWAVENFYKEYYLYRRGDIQAGVYLHLANHAFKDLVDQGYIVAPPAFLVCDSTGYHAPLIYQLTYDDIDEAFNGYTYRDVYYPGIKEIVEDLSWAKDTGIWNISRKHYNNGGIVKLKE